MTRTAPVCEHGQTGWCHDSASTEERDTFTALHRHAYAWALSVALGREEAEEYAAWYAVSNYRAGVEDARWHPGAYEEWRA